MKHPDHIRDEALDLYGSGMPAPDVAQQIKEVYGHDVSANTINSWAYKAEGFRRSYVETDCPWKNASGFLQEGGSLVDVGIYLESEGVPQHEIDTAIVGAWVNGTLRKPESIDSMAKRQKTLERLLKTAKGGIIFSGSLRSKERRHLDELFNEGMVQRIESTTGGYEYWRPNDNTRITNGR